MSNPTELYTSIHHISSLDDASPQDLRSFIETFPVIDNHAHNLLSEDRASSYDKYPFELITSEASGNALIEDSLSTLAHIHAVKQLSEFLECKPTMSDVKEARDMLVEKDYDGFIKKCLKGTHAILMDDGLTTPQGSVQSIEKHQKFVPRVSRIVRIEKVAEEILEAGMDWSAVSLESHVEIERLYHVFVDKFTDAITNLAYGHQVCGFKSVICYRSGLDVGDFDVKTVSTEWVPFIHGALSTKDFRIKAKKINDNLVLMVLNILKDTWLTDYNEHRPPFQFHTGLGDTDINLLKANPAHMQSLIERYPEVIFVLLHSAYPYTREAGYLAAHYPNVYLDIGEVFPMLSRDGQESVLRQSLELVPTSKILWSTDGRFYPETYWLANKQFREALEKVLLGYVENGILSVKQAIDAAANIMFWNSNQLYYLGEEQRYPQLLSACGRGAVLPHPDTNSFALATQAQNAPSRAIWEIKKADATRNLAVWDEFQKKNPEIKYVWLQFLDYTATMRQRIVPVAQFRKHIEKGSAPGLPIAVKGLLQNDHLSAGASITGQFFLLPDLSTLTPNYGIDSPSATVQTWWGRDPDDAINIGDDPILSGCPRRTLLNEAHCLKEEFNINILMGFEVEVVFMKPVLNDSGNDFTHFEPLHMVHSWSNMTTQQLDLLPMIEEIVETLNQAGIPLEQFHAESAPGQWEFPLPCADPVTAVDTLYKARSIISYIAKKHGLRATLYPRPFNNACGSASHAHFSINGPGATVNGNEDKFLAGVMQRLAQIMAFTLSIEESYERVKAGIWAGGVYAAWGTQNKEVPVRKCGKGHWELKMADGIGNMYLGMAVLLAAGYLGLRGGLVLAEKDCRFDASTLSQREREEFGITRMLPDSLEKSLTALEQDVDLRARLGDMVGYYLAVKRAEMEELRGLGGVESEKRRVWLMSRY